VAHFALFSRRSDASAESTGVQRSHSSPISVGALLVLLGAGVAVALPLVCGAVAKTLNSRSVQWAGSRSFSLYLVHVPVIVTLAFALGGHPSVPMQSALGIPVALLVAEAF